VIVATRSSVAFATGAATCGAAGRLVAGVEGGGDEAAGGAFEGGVEAALGGAGATSDACGECVTVRPVL
jgi:hypothetical protein